ncbi:MAG: bifunctional folylpolyglutamate synthase/dihydrofolate synthase [Saprospiraceae bacterium]|nr:bifunctional folylpolyglutamate synthase/dihydrofolate synthase [Saprospiraceae bacterium]
MSYRDTLDYLYARLPMFQRIGPAAFKKDLDNTLALCALLGNPQHRFRSIHVGGTNGKGSVSHMLAAVCQAAGLKTGLYVSPHYQDFRERIKIDGRYISRRRVVEFVAEHRAQIETIEPSFFELCVAMAFDYFAREKVDIAIVEVGLGGRLDSTNVLRPLLSVITNISYDHQNLLGDTLPQIAAEKAGIIKPGIPVVIGETHPESAPVFLAKAAETGSAIVFADQHIQALEHAGSDWRATEYNILIDGLARPGTLRVDAAGPYQAKNVATVLQALACLPAESGIRIPPAAIGEGLAQLRSRTRFQGRWQVLGQSPTILCDSAHNEAGIRLAFAELARRPFRRLHVVTGFVNDKEVDKVLGLFPAAAQYYFAKANIPRGLDASVLRDKAATFGLQGKAYVSVRNAFQAARRAAAPEDLVLVIGSIFVVAEVLPRPR